MNSLFFIIILNQIVFLFLTVSLSFINIKKYQYNIILSFILENFFLFFIKDFYIFSPNELCLLLIISFLLKLIYIIYIPLLIDRSFSLLILFILSKKNFNKNELKIYIKKNFLKIYNKRINFFSEKKILKFNKNRVVLNKNIKNIIKIYLFFKKNYLIKNNDII